MRRSCIIEGDVIWHDRRRLLIFRKSRSIVHLFRRLRARAGLSCRRGEKMTSCAALPLLRRRRDLAGKRNYLPALLEERLERRCWRQKSRNVLMSDGGVKRGNAQAGQTLLRAIFYQAPR